MKMDYKKSDLTELKRIIIQEIEVAIFSTPRSKEKVKGGREIENDSGDLRESVRRNLRRSNFIKVDKNGNLDILINLIEYYKFLDDGTKNMPGWFITNEIFENDIIRKKVKEIQAKTFKRAIINVVSNMNK